ncbi:hypothetical protein NDU88_003474 [Pleurodeles waltl]|uniref:Uncharacterized protein n=1 Tax=Pleurodeles waltl TaxID=8319 RepID=A0AAV7M3G9_PLEWA|nr:hypothetical protein NDU88_003474 [Pleurodeles waltl]
MADEVTAERSECSWVAARPVQPPGPRRFGVGLHGGVDGGEESLRRGTPLDRPVAVARLECFAPRVWGDSWRHDPVP